MYPTFTQLLRKATKEGKIYSERPHKYPDCKMCGNIAFPCTANSRKLTTDLGHGQKWFSPEYCFLCII